MEDCTFCKILRDEIPSYPVWEDEAHVALLTPFPNTPGFTVLITKDHVSSNVFHLADDRYAKMFSAAKHVSSLLEKSLGVRRVGLIAEGMGVDHAHIKLIPLHGLSDSWKSMQYPEVFYSDVYTGLLTSHNGPEWSHERLIEMQQKIRSVL